VKRFEEALCKEYNDNLQGMSRPVTSHFNPKHSSHSHIFHLELYSARDYQQLAELLCPDFPFEIVENAAKIAWWQEQKHQCNVDENIYIATVNYEVTPTKAMNNFVSARSFIDSLNLYLYFLGTQATLVFKVVFYN
jgi:hypothetical protein